jgi:hypothetical protein
MRSTTAASSSKSLEAGQRAVIEALRKFVDTVDPSTLPPLRRGAVHATGNPQLCDGDGRPVLHTQCDFIRKDIDSTAKSLSRRDGAKPNAAPSMISLRFGLTGQFVARADSDRRTGETDALASGD